MQLFGFEISRTKKQRSEVEDTKKSFTPPVTDDGAVTITSGSYFGQYVDLDGTVRNEVELITRYREMSMQPELETGIDEIVNEAIVTKDNGQSVELNTDDLKQPESIKKKIREEFDYILKLLNFGYMGHDLFRRWYIDGRLFYHVIIDENRPTDGIQELRYIDPRRIRKIREIQKTKDKTGMEIIKSIREYYLYNERGVIGTHSNLGAKIATDSIINVNSGLMDSKRVMVLSYLHKAIKPLNNLRMLEDATVIYRLSRAPERRIFYIDVGNMPTVKAEQYLKNIMNQYRNKLVYDSSTGEIKDDRKHMSMLEDFFLPRREGNRGTEISTLPSGQNLGQIEDVQYFERKLYKALNVPISRLEPQQGFALGRTTEITRDELRFNQFITRLRNKFTGLFDDLLRIQLVLKKICTEDEWKEFREDVWYDFLKDNNFEELKESELLLNRLATLAQADPFVGKYLSIEWARREILKQTDEDIEKIDAQIAAEVDLMAPAEDPTQMGATDPAQQDPQQIAQADMPQGGGIAPDPTVEEEEPTINKFEIQEDEMEIL